MVPVTAAYMTVFRRLAILPESSLSLTKVIMISMLPVNTLHIANFNCSMFCCALLFVHSSFAIILIGKRELIALLRLSSWCLVIVM